MAKPFFLRCGTAGGIFACIRVGSEETTLEYFLLDADVRTTGFKSFRMSDTSSIGLAGDPSSSVLSSLGYLFILFRSILL